MDIERSTRGNYCVVRINGRLDASTSSDLDRDMAQIIQEGNTRIVFDLSNLEYVSSAGLRIFLVVAKKLKAAGGELSLAGLKGNIKEVVEISGFPSILPCFDTVADLPS